MRSGFIGGLLPALLLLPVFLLLASGCASSRGGGPRSASLSDAAKQIEKDEPRKRPLVVREKDPDDGDGPSLFALIFSHDGDRHHRRRPHREPRVVSEGEGPSWERPRFYFGGSTFSGEADMQPDAEFHGGSLRLGAEMQSRWRAELEISHASIDPGRDWTRDALRDRENWLIGANARCYLTPGRHAFQPYALFGANVGALHWDYAEPVEISHLDDWGHPAGRRWVDHDYLGTGSVYLGGGVSFLRSRHVELGANARLGGQFYGDTTEEGLRNDLFESHGFGSVALEFSIFPGR